MALGDYVAEIVGRLNQFEIDLVLNLSLFSDFIEGYDVRFLGHAVFIVDFQDLYQGLMSNVGDGRDRPEGPSATANDPAKLDTY